MRRLAPLLTTAALLSASAILGAADDLVLSRFSDYLNSLRAQAGIPGLSATIVGNTSVTWEQAYGLADVERNVYASPSTPYEVDGLTETATATLLLRCVEDGSLTLDDLVGTYSPSSPDAGATLRQILSYTSPGPGGGLVYSYRPERLISLADVATNGCTGQTYSASISGLLYRLNMFDSVPGSSVVGLSPPPAGIDNGAIQRFNGVLAQLATPYAVDAGGHATPGRYSATTLTPTSGLISTVRDLAKFDLGVKSGFLRPESLAQAWTPPLDGNGRFLPHGFGWFSQVYNGERVVWQFGVSDNASSSMTITVPGRGLTLILLANSQGLVRPFPLAAGDVTASPFARLFLGTFVR
jgi:CubicO group peptidase (beta-lactamase class C family)